MSFRSLLVAIALAVAPAGTILAQDAVPQPDVANSKYQIEGVINAPSVYVRSGPGEGYYPTQQLDKGTAVTVVGIKFDWLKIIPPDSSYSYVGAVFVDRNGDGSAGKINRNDVNIRAGSLINPMKTTVQMRLNTGDIVQIIGKEDEYLKIKPPAGAYLYINKQFVTVARPALTQNPPPANPSAPAPSVTVTAAPAAPAPTIAGPAVGSTAAAPAPPSIENPVVVTRTPTTAPSPAVASATPATQPAAVAVAPPPPPPSPDELFAQYESEFTDASKQPLDQQPIDDLIAKYQSIAGADTLSDELKQVVRIRIATLTVRADNKARLVEARRLEKVDAERQLALQAEQQELAERLKQSAIQVFSAVGTLQPSSLQIGSGMLYRLTDPGTGRTVVYIRTDDSKVTALMGQFIGVTGDPRTDSQLSLRVITPNDAQVVDPAKVNSSVMADIVPPSLLARTASSN